MRRLALALCALITVCTAAAIALAAVPVTGEIAVNEQVTDGQQDDAQVAMDADGDFTVAWQTDEPPVGVTDDIYIRRFDPTGTPTYDEIVAHSDTVGDQDDPTIASDADGNGVVAFHSDVDGVEDIKAHLFDTDGPLDESDIDVDVTLGDQVNPAVAMDADGDFVVVWQGPEPGGSVGIFARTYDGQGNATSSAIPVTNDEALIQREPAVAMDGDGDFVVAWEGTGVSDTNQGGVFAQRYDAGGSPVGNRLGVNTTTAGFQENAAAGMDADGDFVIAWDGPGAGEPDDGVFVQRFNAAGNALGSETLVNTTADGFQRSPSVTLDADGDFAVAWDGEGAGDDAGVFTRDFSAAGVPLAAESLVGETVPDTQQAAWVSSDADGDFVVSWETDYALAEDTEDVFARRFARGSPGQPGNGGPSGGGGGSGGGTGTSQTPPQLDDMGLPVLTDADVGRLANVATVRGVVLLGIPPGLATAGHPSGASQKGVTFVPLTEARQIPIRSFLDTRRGTVRLRSATGSQNGTQTGDFGRGLFQVLQSSRRSARGLTDLALKGGSFARRRCRGRGRSAGAQSAQLSRRTVRRLRSNANGRFRTRGRHSAATVRGTVWQTTDRCDGTLTKVTRGSVVVRDFRRRKNIVVRAGKRTKGAGGGRGSYFARAR